MAIPVIQHSPSSETHMAGLALFFTLGVSLTDWERTGYLQREVMYYQHLTSYVGPITFVTYGGDADLALRDQLGDINILANPQRFSPPVFERRVPTLYKDQLANAAILKSSQLKGAKAVIRTAAMTGAKSVIRGGYLLSRFAESSPLSMRVRFDLWRRELALFHQADRVFVATPDEAHYARRWYGLAASKVAIIPHFVNTDLFAPRDDVDCDPGLVGFVGWLAPQKNLTALITAMSGLSGMRLRLIGEGPQRAELEALAKECGVDAEFVGNVPHTELPRLLAECEIFVLPSLYEGPPKALLEAMSAGLPVIAARAQGSGAVIRHRDTGWLCEDTSADGLRRALVELMEDSRLRTQMGRAARRYIQQNFSLDRILTLETDVYRELGVV